MHQAEDVADPKALDQLLHLLAYRFGRPGDDVAAVDQILPAHVGIVPRRRLSELRQRASLDRLYGAIARRVGEPRIDVQASVVEVVHMRSKEPFGLGVGVGDADHLGKTRAIRRRVDLPFLDALPVTLHQQLGAHVPRVAEVGIRVGIVDAEVVGLDRAAAGNEDRRRRLLDRLGPAIDVAQLGIAAVEGERFVGRPRLADEIVRLGIFLARQRRDRAVGVVGVHRGADRKARHQTAARQHVEHGHLLGNPQRRIVERDRITQHDQRGLRRAARQGRGHDVGRRHQTVGVGVMLVHADAVEADALGEFELVEILVIDAVAELGLVHAARQIDPHRTVLLPEIVRHVRPRHQVEPGEFHGHCPLKTGSRFSRKAVMPSFMSAVCISGSSCRKTW